jgi:hypothetical protein
MTKNMKPILWVDVIAFIKRSIPMLDRSDNWHHKHITAYQIGCEALAALGQAEEKDWGARPLEFPRLPDVLPRWDDICATVLGLADQNGLISYRLVDGVEAPSRFTPRSRAQEALLPPANIAPAYGLGPGHAAPALLPVLQSLGLVKNGCWTEAAETVLWREQPAEWELKVTADPRFVTAVNLAATAIPKDIRSELNRLATITDADVARVMARKQHRQDRLEAEALQERSFIDPPTPESVRDRFIFVRRHDLDDLFFDSWRLQDGWLPPDERSRALSVFHDPLAVQTRRAVVRCLYPGEPGLAE